MKDKRLSLRMPSGQITKLRNLAAEQGRTMTQLVSDWINSLPEPKVTTHPTRAETMNWQVLPPEPSKCRSCAVAHPEEIPHDATSLYYQVLFMNSYGRSPTWRDAMSHCCPEMQKEWIDRLTGIGIDVDSAQVSGDIKSEAELIERLKALKVQERESSTAPPTRGWGL